MAYHNIENWKHLVVSANTTMQAALENIEKSGYQIAFAVDADNQFNGVISDGDIRRFILKGAILSDPIKKIINKNCEKCSIDVNGSLAFNEKKGILTLPIVDQQGKLVGAISQSKQTSDNNLDCPFVIMAGGKGKRLQPLTKEIPKPLVLIDGQPMMLHIIEKAKKEGFDKFIISLNHMGDKIKSWFGDGSKFEVRIDYVEEKEPLGTAGALGLLTKSYKNVFVTNCDIISSVSYSDILEFHLKHRRNATMAVKHYKIVNPYGVVQVDGFEISGFAEKPVYTSLINAGMYVIDCNVLDLIRHNERLDMPELFSEAIKNKLSAAVYPLHEDWVDVGIPSELAAVRSKMGNKIE